MVIHSYRHRLGLAPGYPQYADIEANLAGLPVITVPTVTLDGEANGIIPASDGRSSAAKFSGRRIHHRVPNAGHALPQQAPKVTGRELRALRRLQREQESKSPFVFVSERGTPFSTRGFQAMVERAAKLAGFDMKIHPHMLRHSCGYKLANDGVDTRTIQGYLGHKSIQHTVRYTELAPTRFKGLFRD